MTLVDTKALDVQSSGFATHVKASEGMHTFNMYIGAPVTLLINYSLFQYLTTMYFARRRQWRVASLIFAAFLGFVVLVPQASPDEDFVDSMNDVSELCSALTFLTQVTIIGHDVLRRVKVPALRYLTYSAEVLAFLSWVLILVNFIELAFTNGHALGFMIELDNIVEIVSLSFVFFFRFYYLSLAKNGWKAMAKTRKMDIFLYMLFMTHEYPFMILTEVTGDSWEFVQALYMRVTMAMCLITTIRDKIRSRATNCATSGTSRGPQVARSFEGGATSVVPGKSMREH